MMKLANNGLASDTNQVNSVSEPVVAVDVNWEDFLKRNDPVWEKLPKTWMEKPGLSASGVWPVSPAVSKRIWKTPSA